MAKKGNRKEEGLMMGMKRESSHETLGTTVHCSAMGGQWRIYVLQDLSDCFMEK